MLARVQPDEVEASVYESFWRKFGPAYRLFQWILTLTAFVGAAHLARWGTTSGRTLSALVLLGCGSWLLIAHRRFGKRSNRRERVLRDIVGRVDAPLADRIRRAFGLVTFAAEGRVSVELARLHLSRLWQQISLERVTALGEQWSSRVRIVTVVLVALTLGGIAFDPFRVVEGTNVLLAYRGKAPLTTTWLQLDPIAVQSPAYLHEPAEWIEFGGSASIAKGSVLTIRGTSLVTGRNLLLTDGQREIPFVSDGQGGLLARYSLDQSVGLAIASRFGSVLVFQKPTLLLRAVADEPPEVELQGAPMRIDIAQLSEVPLRYTVRDDHGVSVVELVLRSGAQQEQRKLIQLASETHRYEGAHVLKTDDPFILQGTGTVEVQILARDNNGVDGSKATTSQSFWLDKPSVGAPQVEQLTALKELRSALVDWFDLVTRGAAAKTCKTHYEERVLVAQGRYLGLLGTGGQRSHFVRSFVRAQLDKLLPKRVVGPKGEQLLVEATLAVDALLEALSQRDAEQVSRQLARIAEEIEVGAKELQFPERREQAIKHVFTACDRLRLGSEMLTHLGTLGADLGQIALAGVTRISRVAQHQDYKNVERAASFLAERLNRPVPSFVGGIRPSVESGARRSTASGGSSDSVRPSEADTRFERVVSELGQLAEEHATASETVRQLVDQYEQALGNDETLPEADKRATELRRIVSSLPNVGGEPGSPRASAALAKELTHGAAESLSRHHLGAALESLKQADDALSEAERATKVLGVGEAQETGAYRQIRGELTLQYQWIETQLDEMRKRVSRKSLEAFREVAQKERDLSERAQTIAARETKDDAVLPEDYRSDLEQAARLMKEAALALDSAKGQSALERQHRAQQLLERAELGGQEDGSADPQGKEVRGAQARREPGATGTVAVTSDSEARERFRRRVLEGLAKDLPPEGSVKVRRYAEGLLR